MLSCQLDKISLAGRIILIRPHICTRTASTCHLHIQVGASRYAKRQRSWRNKWVKHCGRYVFSPARTQFSTAISLCRRATRRPELIGNFWSGWGCGRSVTRPENDRRSEGKIRMQVYSPTLKAETTVWESCTTRHVGVPKYAKLARKS
jgi:hypothetical protein